ncbi:MAG: patatin-like phospholipase family protein [Acidobacteriota bacterium]
MTSTAHPLQVGLALCGGGSRGAVEVGFYRALQEMSIRIDSIAGCSIGALNGAFIASGYPPDRLMELWQGIDFRDLFRFRWTTLFRPLTTRSLFKTGPLRRLLETHLPKKRFEELQIPLTILGLDLRRGATVRFEKGDLIEAILASIALPGIFPAVLSHGRLIIDGCLGPENPYDVVVEKGADLVLLMLTRPCGAGRVRSLPNLFSMLARSFEILLDLKCRRDIRRFRRAGGCLILLEPDEDIEASLLDFDKTREMEEIGYRCALRKLAGFPYCELVPQEKLARS